MMDLPYTLYETESGKIVCAGTVTDETLAVAQAGPGQGVILAHGDEDRQYVQDGALVDRPLPSVDRGDGTVTITSDTGELLPCSIACRGSMTRCVLDDVSMIGVAQGGNVMVEMTPPWPWQTVTVEIQGPTPDGTGAVIAPTDESLVSAAVNEERARRLAEPMPYLGTTFDMDPVSKQRITGAGALAGFALGNGALPGDLFWHDGDTPFAWIDAENARVPMDALTCFGLAQAAARREGVLIGCADILKRMPTLPEDWQDDAWWSD